MIINEAFKDKTLANAGPDPFTGMLQMLRKCYEERLGNAIDEVIV